MKVFTLVLSLLLSFNLFAATTELGALIDDHQFFLTVEWDQKDQRSLEAREKLFGEKFAEITRREKLTREDLLKLIEERVQSPELVKRLRVRLNLLPLNPSAEAMKTFLEATKKDLYAQGASWNGDSTVTISIAVALVLITAGAVFLAVTSKKDVDCHYDSNSYGCKNPGTNVCTEWGQEWRCSTSNYTDIYGQTRTQETCGYYEACVSYSK